MLEFGARFDNDSYYKTMVDEDNNTARIIGENDGVPVDWKVGASSDFSTASMTIIDNGVGNAVIYPSVETVGDFDICVANQGNSGTHPVVLYKGKAGVLVHADSHTLSGDATDIGEGMVLVTGDCTITLSTRE